MFALLIYVGYIALWVLLVFLASYISWKLFKSKAMAIIAGLVAFGVMYWPAFGDLVPTLLAHKQLCEKEAGFNVYVTPEQWEKDNPGVLETLVPYEKYTAKGNLEFGNERIGMTFDVYSYKDLAVRKEVEKIIDVKTNKVLSENIDFSRGYGSLGSDDFRSIKFWLYLSSCYKNYDLDENLKQRKYFYKLLKTTWSN